MAVTPIRATPPRIAGTMLVAAALASAVFLGWLIARQAGAAVAVLGLIAVFAASLGKHRFVRSRSAAPEAVGRIYEAELGRITDEVGLGHATIARDGTVLTANSTFAGLIGNSHVAGSFAGLFAVQDRPAIGTAIGALLSGDGTLRDLRIEPVGRANQPVLITLGYAARFDRLFAIAKDDSLQLRLESQMRHATKMQAVGQLAGGLAHDFNNILTAIIGHCDLMLMRHGPGDIDRHDADQIRQNANRAADLIRQLLAFSRQQTLRTRVVAIDDVVGEMSHLLRRLLGDTVRFEVVQGASLAPVRVDPGQIEQVLVNLAVNARDAMPGGGTLTIATHMVIAADVASLGHAVMPVTDYVAITVEDSGSGIPTEIIGNVFDPFFTTKDFGKGTGLGLAIAYGIVKQSNGFIFVDSSLGRGTRFNIYLPAAIGAPAEVRAAPASAALEGWGHGTILLVEDDAMVRAVAARALTRSGYDVLTAAGGEEALGMLGDRVDVDLLITDVVMLGMDGPTLVARARAAQPDLRALFISGYAEEEVRMRVDDPGIPLIRKPFSVQELSVAVRTRLAA